MLIVLQFCENGSLLSFLKKHTGFYELKFESKLKIMCDIAAGMEYLAACHVVHRDLAARNVLLSSDFVCKVRQTEEGRRKKERKKEKDEEDKEEEEEEDDDMMMMMTTTTRP